jgi:hypothetical protein
MSENGKLKGERLADVVSHLLNEEGVEGVLRIGALHKLLIEEHQFEYVQGTLSNRLNRYSDNRKDEECKFKRYPNGYITLPGVDFDRWRSENLDSRPSIDADTKRHLWARAAGQCEFPNCQRSLTKDNKTGNLGNFGQIAHNVAASPNGPRGDDERSTTLSDEYENLLLLCYKHHRIIDVYEEDYPVSQVRNIKQDHEERIEYLLSLENEDATTPILLEGPIGGQPSLINHPAARKALRPKFPREIISLSLNESLKETDEEYWAVVKKMLHRQLREQLFHKRDKVEHLSVFPLAPLPSCILLGRILGDKVATQLYQHHREASPENAWLWNSFSEQEKPKVEIVEPQQYHSDNDIAIAVELSQELDEDAFSVAVGDGDLDVYRVKTEDPGQTWLQSKEQLEGFQSKYRALQEELEKRYGKKRTVHILGPMPAPIAVELGRLLHPKVAPKIITYDYLENRFEQAITIKSNFTL